jgi:hypothetical protein
MTLFRRQSVIVGFGAVLIAGLAVCPMIGAVGAGWSASNCHDATGREAPTDSSSLTTCCAVEVLAGALEVARSTHTPSSDRCERPANFVVTHGSALQRAERYSRSHQPHPTSPPLFLHHVSLLI